MLKRKKIYLRNEFVLEMRPMSMIEYSGRSHCANGSTLFIRT